MCSRTTSTIKLQWPVLRNGGTDFLHSRFIDSIYIYIYSKNVVELIITKR